MLRVTKKEAIFFKFFSEVTATAMQASLALEDLMTNYTDVENKIKKIEKMEHDCDMLIHKILTQLNAAFITPIDREDIYLIAKELDNIVDHIEAAAHRFTMYNVKEIKPEAITVAKMITSSVKELEGLMTEMINMKISDALKQRIIEINRIENEGDLLYRSEISKLFANETDPMNVMRWQGIYGYLEKALDATEDVANIVEGVVMKHA